MAGFGGNLIQWFDSYLTRRKQRLTVLGATSTIFPVTSGVSQGFMLGPVLFTLYTYFFQLSKLKRLQKLTKK